jgi:hypothetical protein
MIETGMSLQFSGQGKYKIFSADPDLCTDYNFGSIEEAKEIIEAMEPETMDEDIIPVVMNRRGKVVYEPGA